MSRYKLVVISIVFALIMSFSGLSIAQDVAQEEVDQYAKINNELQSVLLENFDAYEKEEIFRVLETIHTQSPAYIPTKDVSNQIFPDYDLKYEMVSFKYLMTDDEFALARVVQKTEKVSGPAFRNNVLDLIVVFKQEDNKWKLWSQVILGLEYL